MSRYCDYDDYDGEPAQILDQGRWEHNARRVLTSRRGRKALEEIRDALLALPEPRLIAGAMCTAGGADAKLPALTAAELQAIEERERARTGETEVAWTGEDWAAYTARCAREAREDERAAFTKAAGRQGAGVCLIGAYLWHREVQGGASPDEAFAALPALTSADSGDPLSETAQMARDAGMAYTLAWELAYRNDETYGRMTPEERYEAFLGWIGQQLGSEAAA